MPPNFADPNIVDPENVENSVKITSGAGPSSPMPFLTPIEVVTFDKIGLVLSWLILVANILSGATVSAVYIYAFQQNTLGATPLHAILCSTGYLLLMGQAILSLGQHNGWTSKLSLVHKKRVHTILQVLGSVLAITGSFIKIADKETHWTSLHGQFALVALVFTSVGLVNGLASLYAQELRRFMPGKLGQLTKIGHICFGTVAFCSATVALCTGLQKGSFVTALNQSLANSFVAFAVIVTVIIIISPLLNFYKKTTALR